MKLLLQDPRINLTDQLISKTIDNVTNIAYTIENSEQIICSIKEKNKQIIQINVKICNIYYNY